MNDDLARLRAQADQTLELMTELAEQMGRYFNELLDQHFTRDEALAMTLNYQAALLANARGEGEGQ